MTDHLDLDTRAGLPEEWLFLRRQHPKELWAQHQNLGPLTEFWLSRHDGFRQLAAFLSEGLTRFREGDIPAEKFGPFFAPRLQQFLSELHHHHMIEDHHYFPVFMAAESRLLAGFELLENDHELIHHRIEAVVEKANLLFGKLGGGDRDDIQRAADGFALVSDTLITGLGRHLDDEEDLVVPLILERGERELGVG